MHVSGCGARGKSARMRGRLSILLHELCHAIFIAYACEECPKYSINGCGHGRAWQDVAVKMEESGKRVLSIELDLMRFYNVGEQAREMGVWPSLCDLKRWRLMPGGENKETKNWGT